MNTAPKIDHLTCTLDYLCETVVPSQGLTLRVSDRACLFGFWRRRDDGQILVDISTREGEDRNVLILGRPDQRLSEIVDIALDRHGQPAAWPVWASPAYAKMAAELG